MGHLDKYTDKEMSKKYDAIQCEIMADSEAMGLVRSCEDIETGRQALKFMTIFVMAAREVINNGN